MLEYSGARPMPRLTVAALVIAAVFLAFPASPAAPPSEAAPVTATTVASAGLDGGDALAALFAGVAVGSLAFSHDMRRSRRGS